MEFFTKLAVAFEHGGFWMWPILLIQVSSIAIMMRSKPSSSMQKTYDESYLHCSTAVFFEGQVSTSNSTQTPSFTY